MLLQNSSKNGFILVVLLTQNVTSVDNRCLWSCGFPCSFWTWQKESLVIWGDDVYISASSQSSSWLIWDSSSSQGSLVIYWEFTGAPRLLACPLSWILNSIWTQQCQGHLQSTCLLGRVAPAAAPAQSISRLGGCGVTATNRKEVKRSNCALLLRPDGVTIPSDFLSFCCQCCNYSLRL